jgi:hypothetical protein
MGRGPIFIFNKIKGGFDESSPYKIRGGFDESNPYKIRGGLDESSPCHKFHYLLEEAFLIQKVFLFYLLDLAQRVDF